MKKMKTYVTLGLAATVAFSTVACGQTSDAGNKQTENAVQTVENSDDNQETEQQAEENTEEKTESSVTDCVVSSIDAGENKVLVVYPTPNTGDTLGVSITCTAPVFVVFGDGVYDEDSAKAYAMESGLADLAAKEGSSVCFVNPTGETWSDADVEAYGNLIGIIDDSSTSDVKNGLSTSVNVFTQEEETKITGTTGRVYVYGIGSGADFVAKNFVKPVKQSVTYGDGVTMEFDRTATAVTLVDASDASGIEANDMTVVSVNGSEELNAALQEKCGTVVTADAQDFIEEYSAVGANRRQAGVLVPVYNWADEGISEKIETYTVKTSDDNVTFAGQETHDINYVTYYADDLDVENGNVPLVLAFHGGGNTALYEAQATQWPLIGKEHGFITVSVDLHFPNETATEIVDLIKHLEEEYSIDSSRIYASGFSMGGCKSWDLFEQYPEVFAGLAPMDATMNPGEDSFGNAVENINKDILMPVFYVGGETSPLPELPFQDVKCVDRMAYVFDVNDIVTEYTVSFDNQDSWTNQFWGIDGDLSYDITDTTFKDSTMSVELFASSDGKYYSAFALAGNQSHEVYARNSWAAYDFLSQFSRNEDGGITISDVEYSLASDDGTVKDNSYNR